MVTAETGFAIHAQGLELSSPGGEVRQNAHQMVDFDVLFGQHVREVHLDLCIFINIACIACGHVVYRVHVASEVHEGEADIEVCRRVR